MSDEQLAKPIPMPEEAMKVAAEWAGVSEIFLMSRVVDNPERTGFTALYEMTKRALRAESRAFEYAQRIAVLSIEKEDSESRVRELEQALRDIKKHIEIIAPQLAPLNTSWKIACTALAALHVTDKAAKK